MYLTFITNIVSDARNFVPDAFVRRFQITPTSSDDGAGSVVGSILFAGNFVRP